MAAACCAILRSSRYIREIPYILILQDTSSSRIHMPMPRSESEEAGLDIVLECEIVCLVVVMLVYATGGARWRPDEAERGGCADPGYQGVVSVASCAYITTYIIISPVPQSPALFPKNPSLFPKNPSLVPRKYRVP